MPQRRPHRSLDHAYPASDQRVSARFLRLASGVTVRAVEAGPPEGPAVVLLPGWAVSAFTYRHQLPALAAAGYRATAVDLKGHGFADKPTGWGEYTFDAMLRHVEEIVDAVSAPPVVIVAQSMAGALAMDVAIRCPDLVSALVLSSPVGLGVIPFIGLARRVMRPFLDPVAPFAVRRWVIRAGLMMAYGDRGRVTDDIVDEYWAPAQFAGFSRALRALVRDFSWAPFPAERLGRLHRPTLVVLGTRDRLVRDAPRLAQRLPRATIMLVDGAGHAVNEEQPDIVNRAIIDFLGKHGV